MQKSDSEDRLVVALNFRIANEHRRVRLLQELDVIDVRSPAHCSVSNPRSGTPRRILSRLRPAFDIHVELSGNARALRLVNGACEAEAKGDVVRDTANVLSVPGLDLLKLCVFTDRTGVTTTRERLSERARPAKNKLTIILT